MVTSLRVYILHREALRKTRQPLTRGAQSPPYSHCKITHPPALSSPTFSFLFDNNGVRQGCPNVSKTRKYQVNQVTYVLKFHAVVFKVATSNRYLPTRLHGVIIQEMTACRRNTCSWRHSYFGICAVLGNYTAYSGNYTAYSGNSLQTFRDKLSVRPYRV